MAGVCLNGSEIVRAEKNELDLNLFFFSYEFLNNIRERKTSGFHNEIKQQREEVLREH